MSCVFISSPTPRLWCDNLGATYMCANMCFMLGPNSFVIRLPLVSSLFTLSQPRINCLIFLLSPCCFAICVSFGQATGCVSSWVLPHGRVYYSNSVLIVITWLIYHNKLRDNWDCLCITTFSMRLLRLFCLLSLRVLCRSIE